MPVLLGLLVGFALAVGDGFLLCFVAKRAASQKDKAGQLLMRGFLARYLLAFGVIALAVAVPALDAVWVVVPLILQKGAMAVLAMLRSRNQK